MLINPKGDFRTVSLIQVEPEQISQRATPDLKKTNHVTDHIDD